MVLSVAVTLVLQALRSSLLLSPSSTRSPHFTSLLLSPTSFFQCSQCDFGLHRVDSSDGTFTCQQDTPCTESFCGPHGTCEVSAGLPHCICEMGYKNAVGSYCSECRIGYNKVPTTGLCEKNDDDRYGLCEAPLLPTDLNTIAYLGGSDPEFIHIQDEYFLDAEHFGNELTFTLNSESYIRVFAAPHDVDIDISIYRHDASRSSVVASRTFSEENIIFIKLLPSVKYSLYVDFYGFNVVLGPCPTFNFELAIQPVSAFNAEAAKAATDCATPSLPTPFAGRSAVLPTTEPFSYRHPETVFAFRNVASEVGKPLDVYKVEFEVPSVPGKRLLLDVEVGYRFLLGDLAIRLYREKDNAPGEKVYVADGYNTYNFHYLHHYLNAGKYELVLYQPAAQDPALVSCVPFEFSFNAAYEVTVDDQYSCRESVVPSTLDSAAFQDDHVHIFDRFLVSDVLITEFTVKTPSVIRVALSDELVFVNLQKKEIDVWVDVETEGAAFDTIFYPSLVAGVQYRLQYFSALLDNVDVSCPSFLIELAIEPRADLQALAEKLNCPRTGDHPVLPTTALQGSYSLPERDYYASGSAGFVVAEYPLDIRDSVVLRAEIASHFLSGNLQLSLVAVKDNIDTDQSFSRNLQLNYDKLEREVGNGHYKLRILRPASAPPSLIPCVKFSFSFELIPTEIWKERPCPTTDLLPLPTTLDSLRYLGQDNHLHLQATNWEIPPFASAAHLGLHTINFTIAEASDMRVYIEDNAVDLDVGLYQLQTDGTSQLVPGAKGASGLTGSESFAVSIPQGVYQLRINYYVWTPNLVVKCKGFSMQLAIVPSEQRNVLFYLSSHSFSELNVLFHPPLPPLFSSSSFLFVLTVSVLRRVQSRIRSSLKPRLM